ncbi:MAG TPA: fibronectin type III domain-containing protein [Pseudonocardiaceae bacterium]|jgi:hypothetical protein|nr:fibronectin type III domain-containing protein [Pseudonocardiaceae bacterium]
MRPLNPKNPATPRILAAVLLVLALAGCTDASAEANNPPAPNNPATPANPHGIVLTARLVGGRNVMLSWRDNGPPPAGEVVEYANASTGPYTILDFLPPGQTTYSHPNLIPDTAFYYRVLPYYGPASNAVTVRLPPGAYNDNAASPDAWATPRTLPGDPRTQESIRDADASNAGAPTNLRATITDANGVALAWTDNASDEVGYLVEIEAAGKPTYQVVQVLDPKINSCGIVTLPDEKTASYRVRAFYYGAASETVSEHTD